MQGETQGKENPALLHAAGADARQMAARPLLLDTQVLLDLWLFEDPRVHLLSLVLPRLDWVATEAMVSEWHYMMARGVKGHPGRPTDGLPRPRVLPAPANAAPWRCRDPDDQMFLDLAHALRPCTLWTRDKALLAHRKCAGLVGVVVEWPETGLARIAGA